MIFFYSSRLKWDSLKLRFWSALQDVCATKLILRRLWEFCQGNDFFDCLLSQFIFSSLPPVPTPPFLFFPRLVLRFFCLPPAVDGNTWAQVIALYPTLVECITCSSSEVSSALKEALGPFKDFMQPPVSRVQNGESWPGSLSALCFYSEEILNVSSWPTCFTSARIWTPREPHLQWHEATHRDPRPARTTSMTPTFIRIIVCFSCELITPLCPLHSLPDWLHSCVNYRDWKKKIAVLPLGLVCFILPMRPSRCTVCGDSVDDVIKKKKCKNWGFIDLKNEHLDFCNIFNSEGFMQENKSYCNIPCHL